MEALDPQKPLSEETRELWSECELNRRASHHSAAPPDFRLPSLPGAGGPMVPSRSRRLLLLTLVCVLPLSPASKEGELPLCAQFEHNSGVWAEAPVRAAAERPPPCCGADRHKWGGAEHGKFMFLDDVKHCGAVPMETDPEFAGDEGVSYSGRRDFLVHLGGYGCSCQHFGWQDRYKWVPDSCRLVEWNARRFCELLGARRILLVGDSTVSQAATVLMNYIHWGFWQAPSSGCQQQVLFANSDTLIGRELGVDNRGGDWKTLVRHFDPDIVIVSSGPHINHPMPYRDADFQSVVAQVRAACITGFVHVYTCICACVCVCVCVCVCMEWW